MTRTSRDELVRSLYDGARQRPYWIGFLDRMRDATGSDYVSLAFRPLAGRRRRTTVLKSSARACDSIASGAGEVMAQVGAAYGGLALRRAYALDEIVSPGEPRAAAYLDYLRGRDIGNTVVLRVQGDAAFDVWLTLGRAGKAFGKAASALLEGLAPHIETAVRLAAEVEAARLQALVAARALSRLNYGWVTFDRAGQVIQADRIAEDLFRRIAHQRRDGLGPQLRRLFQRLADGEASEAEAVRLSEAPQVDMLVVPITADTALAGEAVAVGYVQDEDAITADRCRQLMQLYGLRRTEAKLAIALNAGSTITEAAAALDLTVETARNYSKKIYAKMDASGQADLVRRLSRGVTALV